MKRLALLFDESSFVELYTLHKDKSVVTGYGTVSGRLVYAFSQQGAVDVGHAKKIAAMYELALKMGAPVVGILDSKGAKVSEGLSLFDAYGAIFAAQAKAHGVVPQIGVVVGDCIGMSAMMARLSDFVCMVSEKASFYLESPNTFLDGNLVFADDVKSGAYHSRDTGLVDLLCASEKDCFDSVRRLLGFLPANHLESFATGRQDDDLNREDSALDGLAQTTGDLPMEQIVGSLVDFGEYLELKPSFEQSILTCLGRFNGYTAGILANRGEITAGGLQKQAEFVSFCDAFGLPVVTLTDVKGYMNSKADDGKLIQRAAELVCVYGAASVPRVNIILRYAVGSAFLLMNSKQLGADVSYAWPSAVVSVMDKKAAKKFLDLELDTSAGAACADSFVDDVIQPAATRKRILVSLEMLSSKRIF